MTKNITDNIIGWGSLSLQNRCKILESLTNIYVGYQSIALGSADLLKISDKNKIGAPIKAHDSISTMIKVKIVSHIETDCIWTTMNSIIYHIRSKGGRYSNVSRDTINRRINKLISEKVIKKISTNDINEKELSKISHNRTFNFVYAANDEYINVLKNLKNYPPAPLDDFINHVTDFISNLPEEKRNEIQKKISENIIN